MNEEPFEMPLRPRSIYLVTLWSIARAVYPLLMISGLYHLSEMWTGQRGVPLCEWLTQPSTLLAIAPLLAQTIVFFVLAPGIFLGHSWARSGFLWATLVVLVWNLRGIVLHRTWSPYSLIALPLATWYFRRPNVLEYYGVEDRMPRWLNRKVGGLPIDLAVVLGVLAVSLLSEVVYLTLNWEKLANTF